MKFKLGILSLLILIIAVSAFAGIPAEIKLQGWELAKSTTVYSREKLTDHINGAAEIYYTYAVKDVTVYEFEQKGKGTIAVDIYDMTNSDDAFGIYSFNRSGSKEFVEVGNEGINAPGLLDFWIAQYYVRISAGLYSKLSNADMIGVGKLIAGSLATKKAEEPKLVKLLPTRGLTPGSSVYFHQKLILNNVVPEVNRVIDLRLNSKTKAVYAEYGFANNTVKLVTIEYPTQLDAQKSWETLNTTVSTLGGNPDNFIVLLLNVKGDPEEQNLLLKTVFKIGATIGEETALEKLK